MIKVYYANVNELSEDAVFQEKLKRICNLRKTKVLHCKMKDDQLRSLAAGLLIRHALEEEMLSYEDIKFETNSHGKIIVDCDIYPVWLNVSHSGDFAAVAFSNFKVGIDIQQQRDMKSEDRMKAMCYTEAELESKYSFFYHWTRKEAYAKMMGLGMQMDFKTIDTLQEDYLWTKRVEGDYWMSVASSHQIQEVEVRKVSLNNL